jgi:hypothetical protein
VKIEEKEELKCPNCDDEISMDKVELILEKDSDLLVMYLSLNHFDGLNVVMCPNCGKICPKDEYSNRITCTNGCDDFCEVCGLSHNPGIDWRYCPNERDIENEFESIGFALNDTNIQRCPLCKIMIEHTEGCNSMKCTNCKLKFCWSCLKSSSEIKRMQFHECDNYGTFLKTDSDSEYKSGSDYDVD